MALNIEIYRGDQIGGCVTVISTERGSIMIDYGEELPGSAGGHPEDDEKLRRLLETAPPKAVFFTHYHGDHIGRFAELVRYEKDGQPIALYMGETCLAVMKNIQSSLACCDERLKTPRVSPSPHAKALDILNSERTHTFRDGVPIREISGFTVEPIRIDHSAFDACMFLITAEDTEDSAGKETAENTGENTPASLSGGAAEAGCRRILHTGDFRNHGHQGKIQDIVTKVSAQLRGREVHTLITEGTVLSRPGGNAYSEERLYADALALLREHRSVFLAVSSTNPDSIGSFYRAARENHIPFYCYGAYLAAQLNTFREAGAAQSDFYDFNDLRPMWSRAEEMRETGFLAVVKMEDAYLDFIIREFGGCKVPPVFVYSMWKGYLDGSARVRNEGWRAFREAFIRKFGPENFRVMHTGGHADRNTIARLIREVRPTREIIPIHTENAAGFLQLDIEDEYRKKLRLPEKLRKRLEHQAARRGDRMALERRIGGSLPGGILFFNGGGTVRMELTRAATPGKSRKTCRMTPPPSRPGR